MALAFFDLDLTLISRNSGTLWVRQELREGRMTPLDAARAAAWLLRYRLGAVGLEEALERSLASVRGTPESELAARVERFYLREVRPLFRREGRVAVDAHRASGDRLVLITAGSSYVGEHVARELGLDHAIGSRLEVDADGRFTGRTDGPLCYGAGKRVLAERYANAHGLSLAAATFYTDSYADLPLLEAVGAPRAVHPDRRLRLHAERSRWPILAWR
jgi:HAD superfamily hydrolase (TIGR01490 family)